MEPDGGLDAAAEALRAGRRALGERRAAVEAAAAASTLRRQQAVDAFLERLRATGHGPQLLKNKINERTEWYGFLRRRSRLVPEIVRGRGWMLQRHIAASFASSVGDTSLGQTGIYPLEDGTVVGHGLQPIDVKEHVLVDLLARYLVDHGL